ncbi:DUF7507 domain-containing protein [Neotamlana laminarinivorans]|uniref:DUF11 domain-containing protein n=1 Tax=Neotamlana laminarinivorans TaxID=2883124 RepID=A0A9X1HX07_9FLAO|nr:PKD-like domain-containing protein [Tamlana laminarinivorans]MCB4797708.1 DUF11 domain-containing protein [Tamlana laminarinivorans]
MKKYLLFTFLCLTVLKSFSQLDSSHYLPPLKQTSGTNNTATHQSTAAINQQAIYLSTPEVTPFTVNVYRGTSTTPWLTIPSLANGSPFTIDSSNGLTNSNNNITLVTNVNTGQVLSNSGLRFEAPGGQQFYVNYRGRSGSQAGSLTCKGTKALGTDFRWGGIANKHNNVNSSTSLGIMATVDGTVVTISGYDSDCAFRDGISPYGLTDDTINITLNAGQTYVLEAVRNQTGTNANATASAANLDGWLGAKITSTQPIAIANGGLNTGISTSSQARDVGIDQPVPTNILGKEYVFIRGNGDANDGSEFPIIVAISNGTEVYADGNLIATIDDGEYLEIPGSYYSGNTAGSNMYVTTSKDAYAFQCLAGIENRIQTIGMNFIAPVNCLLPDSISEIPQIQRIAGTNSNVSALTIIASVLTDDADVEIYQNGVQIATPASTIVQEGTTPTAWKTFFVSGLTGEISVVTPGPIAVGTFMSLGSNAGLAGYFSGFDTVPEVEVTVTGGGCFPGSSIQEVSGSFFSYEWYKDGALVTDTDLDPASFDPTLTGVGDYFVRVTDFGGCTYDSSIISFYNCDPEIQILKTDDADPIDAGSNVTFTITAESFSVNEVTNFVITDVLPPEFDLISATPSTGTSWLNPDWTIGTIQPGEKFTLEIVARAKDEASGTVTNTVTYNFDDIANESNTITDDLSEDVTINPCNTASDPSSTPTLCVNTTLIDITHTTTQATGIGTPVNLPAGVTASWSSDVITITGTPTVSGIYNYSIPLTGGCNTVNATGTITVNELPIANDITGDNVVCIGESISLTEGTTGTISWNSSNPSIATIDSNGNVTGIANGTTDITYTITEANGCTSNSSNNFTVTVNSLPEITSLTTNSDICENETAEFYISGTPNAEVTYNINSNANETITLNATGNATVTFANAPSDITINLISIENTTTNCSTSLNNTETVTVNPFPTLASYFDIIECIDDPYTPGGQILNANDAVTLNPNTTLTWYDAASGGNVVSNPIVDTPTPPTDAPTSYYAQIEDTNTGCINPNRIEIKLQIVNPPFPDLYPEVCSNEALNVGLSFAVTYTVSSSDNANVPPGPDRTTASTNNITDIYVNNTSSPVTVTYLTTIADGSACNGETFEIIVTVYPESNAGSISPDQVICSGDTASDINLTGIIGDVINWERSTSASFSSITNISETTTTLAGSTLGSLTENTYVRAVIKSGNCTSTYSPIHVINIDETSPIITGTLPNISNTGCTAADAPVAVNTVSDLESLGLTISDDFTANNNLNVTHVDTDNGYCPIEIIRTYTIEDNCGNSNDITQNITITIDAFSIADADGASTIDCIDDATETFTLPTVTDSCGDVITPSTAVITENPDPLTCEGTRTYTYTYADCAGNSDTWAYVYTIDTPTLTIADADGASTVNCIDDATETFTLPTVTDSCGNVLDPSKIEINENPNPITCEGTITYIYTYTDCAGSSDIWQFVYTIDTPAFSIADADGASSVNCIDDATETFTLPTVTDVCGNTLTPSAAVITENPDPLTCEGTRTYTYTYTDCAGNSDTWAYVYTIDTPAFSVTDADGASTVNCIDDATETFTLPTVTDVCGNTLTPSAAVITENPDPLTCEGTRTYTYTYTDCAGNSDTWAYVYTIDTPAFSIADADGASTVNCIDDATETFTLPTVTDVCGNTLTPSAAVITENPDPLTCEGTRTYTYTYTDCAGNSDTWAYVYTIDTPAFSVTDADGSSTVNCIDDATETFTLPTVTDVCGNTLTPSAAVITENPDPLTCEGTRTYTYTYTDCAGNSDTWAYVYTIDTPAFSIINNAETSTIECLTDATQPTAPTITDVCGNNIVPVITENTDPECEGDKIYTFTYTDCAGNSAQYVYTYVIDYTISPIVPANETSTVNDPDDAVQPDAPIVTDNCGENIIPVVTENTTPECDGQKIYTFTYTDCSGNTSVYTYTYNIDVTSTLEIEDTTTVSCSDEALNFDLNDLTSLSNVTFDWVITPNSNISGASNGSGTLLNDTINNISGTSQDVIYTITPYNSDGCMGNTFEVLVTINPEPYNNSAPTDTTCSNIALNHNLNNDVNVSGSSFSWVATDNPNVTGETTTPTTSNIITDNLINVSGATQTVIYTITPTSNLGCVGNSYIYTVIVSPEAVLSVNKIALTATDGSYDSVGEIIEYEITVENINEVEVSNITLTDANADSISPASVSSIPAFGSTTFVVTHKITQTDLDAGEVINSASVTATDPCGNVVNAISNDPSTTAPNDSTVTPLIQSPELSLLKDVTFNDENGDGIPQANETLTYNFTISNTGNVSITNISITDPLITVNGGPIDLAPNTSDSTTFAGIYTITQGNIDSGSVTNSATATGADSNGNSVSDISDDPSDLTNSDIDGDGDPDDSTIFTFVESPELTIYKTGVFIDENSDAVAQAGETIVYSFNVINSGNVTISNILISDPLVTVSGSAITLAPLENDNTTFTAVYTLTQNDVDNGNVTNTATASGTSPNGTTVTDTSDDPTTTDSNDATVTELTQQAQISLLKTAVFNDENSNGFPEASETITYIFTVQNTGNTTISNITISDPLVTITGGPINLTPNEIDDTSFTATYVLTLSDVNNGEVENSATVTGEDSNGDTITDVSDDPSNTTNTDINGDGDPDDITITTLNANPRLSIEKTGIFNDENGDGFAQVNETISYIFNVTNIGNVTISNIMVSDALATVSGGPITLNPNENDNTSFTATYSLTQEDIDNGSFSNSATVTGNDPSGTSISDTSDDPNNTDNIDSNGDGEPDDVTVTELPTSSSISLTKLTLPATDGSYNTLGEIVSYELTVTNTGNVTLYNIIVTDTNADSGSIIPAVITMLAPGDIATVSASHTITQDDLNAGFVNNSASVTSDDPFGDVATDISDDPDNLTDNDTDGDGDPDDITTTIIEQDPAMELEKTAIFNDENGDGIPQEGETITYNFTVTNTGNVIISNISITDPLITVNGGPITLMPEEINNSTFYGVYNITQADIDAGSITNTATATGLDTTGNNVSDTSDDPNNPTDSDTNGDGDPDDSTVTILQNAPELTLYKTGIFIDSNGDGLAQVGESIQYIFDISNTGNVTISNITITDPLVNVTGGPISLTPGETDNTTFVANYILTQNDVDNGFVINTATANGNAPNGDTVTDTSDDPTTTNDNDPTNTSLSREPKLTLLKIGDFNDENGDGIPQAGETILYTFIVRNTGNVTLFNVEINDPIVPVTGGPIDLAPAQTDFSTFSALYTILQTDIDSGNLTNTATATGQDIDGTLTTDVSDFSDDPDNPTNEDLNGDGDPDDPTVTTLIGNPELTLEKIGIFNDENGDGIAQVDETITYNFTVTNSGNITITNISISDPLVTVLGGPIDLAPNTFDETTFTVTYAITQFDIDSGNVVNSATASGQDPDGNTISDNSDDPNNSSNVDDNNDGNPDDDTVTTIPTISSIAITKEALTATDGNYDTLGEVITYNIIITNTGNVTLTNLVITDDNADVGSISPSAITILLPGESVSVYAQHTITQTDLDFGSVTNTALVEAQDSFGNNISDESDDPNNSTNNDNDGDGDPDDATVTSINQNANLSLTKAADVAPDGAWDTLGEIITYTLVVTNTGNVTLTNVIITDANADVGSISPANISSLLPGQSVNITANHTITQQDLDAGFVTNTANVNAEAPNGDLVSDTSDDPNNTTDNDIDGDGDPDDSTITTLQQSGSVSIAKTVDFDTYVNIGDLLTYNITVTNTGTVTLVNLIITDPIATITGASTISSLAPGEIFITSAEYIITAEDINNGLVENTAYVNATIINTSNSFDEDSDDPTDSTNIDLDNDGDYEDPTVSTFTGLSDLSIEKVVDNANPVVGDQIIFTITVANEGTVTANNIIVEEYLPSGYEFESYISTSGVYSDNSGEWIIPSLEEGDVQILEVTVTVLGFGDYLNIATLASFEGATDTDLSNNSDDVDTTPECQFVYNEFSPNGDGVNETLYIDCIERYPNNTFEVYNRWGNIVYKKQGYTNTNGWDGLSNGRATLAKEAELPVGTYYYILNLGDGSKPRVGWIYINR